MSIATKAMTDIHHPNHELFVKLPSGKCVRSVIIDMMLYIAGSPFATIRMHVHNTGCGSSAL